VTNQNNLIKKSLRLMVVDDNVDAAESLSALLELHGHILQTAHDGLEAIRLATAFKPQAIFLDIGMPGMNGYETAEELRRVSSLKDVVLVALTGWGAEVDRIKSVETDFNYHFMKPVKINEINTFVSTLDLAS
jgi:CheY-like chemotaxis protein